MDQLQSQCSEFCGGARLVIDLEVQSLLRAEALAERERADRLPRQPSALKTL